VPVNEQYHSNEKERFEPRIRRKEPARLLGANEESLKNFRQEATDGTRNLDTTSAIAKSIKSYEWLV
jgi:hypothetical protein